MFKKIIALCLFSFASCTLVAQEMRVETYPKLKTLTIEVPENWETYNKQIFGIESPNREVEIAGRIFNGKGKTLEQFTNYKHESIAKRMTWYKPTTELISLDNAPYPTFMQEYEGVWPEEKLSSTYIVTTIAVDNYYLSLTFTGLTSNIAKHRDMINSIINSVKLEK